MPPRDWRLRIADILGAVRIGRYTDGLTQEQFAGDEYFGIDVQTATHDVPTLRPLLEALMNR